MEQIINLIPQQEKQEQQKEKLIKASTSLSVGLLVLMSIVSGWYFYQAYQLKKELATRRSSIESLRGQIKGLSSIEIKARNLDSKYTSLKDILNTRIYYSALFNEFKNRLSPSIIVTDFSLSEGSTIALSGTADTYISIAQFVRDLTDPKYPNATKGFEKLFTNVTLNSVNSDSQDQRVKFFVVITFDPALVQKL